MTNVIEFKPKECNLTPTERICWRILASDCQDADALAVHYNVSSQTIRNIKQLKTIRSHRILAAMKKARVKAWVWPKAKRLEPGQVASIRASNKTSGQLGKIHGVSASTIRMIKTGRTYNG